MQPGDLIAGKYRIDQILGQGGMGVVVAATNLHLDQRVALKFLLPEFLGDGTVVERFLREARASARLRSEHVCRVYDVGLENNAPFIVMELLDGRDLAFTVSSGGPLSVSAAADCVLQATIGLAEAHALGIVHRDLKPANLFATRRPDGTALIKILDFGIAKAPSDTQFQLTRTTAVMGSPGYMSPEQLRSTRDADARSDIWALGVILYELVCGRPPFAAESITELTLRVAMDPTPSLPGLPPEFEQVVARCLEKDPNRRFANVSQLAAALAPFGSARIAEAALGTGGALSMSGAGAVPAPTRPESAPTTLGSFAVSLPSPAVRSSRLRWGLAGAVVASVIGTVVLVSDGGSKTPAMTQPGGASAATPQQPEAPKPPATAAAAAAAARAAATTPVPAPTTSDAGIPVVPSDAAVAATAPTARPRPTAPQAPASPPPAEPAASPRSPAAPLPPQPTATGQVSSSTAPSTPAPKPRAKTAQPPPASSRSTPRKDVGESRE